MIRRRTPFAALLASLLASAAASAADMPAPTTSPPPADPGWIVTIGGEARVQPKFMGSDDQSVYPFPIFSYRRPGTPPVFRSPRDGFGIALYEGANFAFGPVGQVVFQRKASDDASLYGLNDVSTTVELGGYADFWPVPWARIHGELRNGIGGHHGLVGEVALDGVFAVTPQWTLSGGPRLRAASSAAVNPYFSVTPTESFFSGLPIYNAGGGLQAVGAGAQARYQWNEQWATHAFVEYDKLVGDTGDSPLVQFRGSDNQWTFGLGATYSFHFAGFHF